MQRRGWWYSTGSRRKKKMRPDAMGVMIMLAMVLAGMMSPGMRVVMARQRTVTIAGSGTTAGKTAVTTLVGVAVAIGRHHVGGML